MPEPAPRAACRKMAKIVPRRLRSAAAVSASVLVLLQMHAALAGGGPAQHAPTAASPFYSERSQRVAWGAEETKMCWKQLGCT